MRFERFINAGDAFRRAIESGVLSDQPGAVNYAGAFMYMGSEGDIDYFKHIDSRDYVESNGAILKRDGIIGSDR